MGKHDNSGMYVKLKDGRTGFTKHKDGLVNGKYAVYLGDGSKMLVAKENLTTIGFKD